MNLDAIRPKSTLCRNLGQHFWKSLVTAWMRRWWIFFRRCGPNCKVSLKQIHWNLELSLSSCYLSVHSSSWWCSLASTAAVAGSRSTKSLTCPLPDHHGTEASAVSLWLSQGWSSKVSSFKETHCRRSVAEKKLHDSGCCQMYSPHWNFIMKTGPEQPEFRCACMTLITTHYRWKQWNSVLLRNKQLHVGSVVNSDVTKLFLYREMWRKTWNVCYTHRTFAACISAVLPNIASTIYVLFSYWYMIMTESCIFCTFL